MELDTVVRSGLVTTAAFSRVTDLGIRDGRVAAIGPHLDAPNVIDAKGRHVVPGPIDPHTHFGNRFGGVEALDDHASGTLAAAVGGVTSVINFTFPLPGQPLLEAVERERAAAAGRAHVDYAFHAVVTPAAAADVAGELPALAAAGVTSLKVFMAGEGLALSRSQLLDVLAAAARNGFVVAVHAEDGPLVDQLTASLIASGHRSMSHLTQARPPAAEAAAVELVSRYAQELGATVYLVHLSSRAALAAVRAARERGARLHVEARPAHLLLSDDRYELTRTRARDFVCWPPLRPADDQAALWEGLESGEIQTIGTDHAGWPRSDPPAALPGFDEVIPGMPGVQTLVALLFAEGVARGRLTIERFVEVTAVNPAKIFGLWPRKGSLAIGSDADLTVIDPGRSARVVSSRMASRSSFDPFDGWTLRGSPVLTMLRGTVVARDGAAAGDGPSGAYLSRPLPPS